MPARQYDEVVTWTDESRMTRRLFVACCLWFPALLRGELRARRDGVSTVDDLVIVNGWVLRKSDLVGRRHDS